MEVFIIFLLEFAPLALILLTASLLMGNSWVYLRRTNYEEKVRPKKS